MFQAKQQYPCLIAFLWPLLMNLWPRLAFQNQASLLVLHFSFVFLELKKIKTPSLLQKILLCYYIFISFHVLYLPNKTVRPLRAATDGPSH